LAPTKQADNTPRYWAGLVVALIDLACSLGMWTMVAGVETDSVADELPNWRTLRHVDRPNVDKPTLFCYA
jgi:hypothetical protein